MFGAPHREHDYLHSDQDYLHREQGFWDMGAYANNLAPYNLPKWCFRSRHPQKISCSHDQLPEPLLKGPRGFLDASMTASGGFGLRFGSQKGAPRPILGPPWEPSWSTWGLQDRFWDPLGSQVGALGGQNGANTRLTFMIPSKINQLFPPRHFLDASMQLRGVPRTIFDRFFVDCSFISE